MFHVPENRRITNCGDPRFDTTEVDGNNGAFMLKFSRPPFKPVTLQILASDGMGWEHVSVRVVGAPRTPRWDEMCFVKDKFWDEEDAVMQLHPRKSEYVNCHPNVLHLWRPNEGPEIPLPPSIMVGLKDG